MAEDDLGLIDRAVAGESAALERLLLAHYDRLAARIARRLPADLRATVSEEDILQQAFIAAFGAIGSFEPKGARSFYRWLCTIAEHRLQDAIKAQRTAKRGEGRAAASAKAPAGDDSYDDLIDLLAVESRTPSRSVARHEAAGAIRVVLAALKEDYRRAIELRYIQRLSVAEVAGIMNRTERSVHNLCRRGLKELHAVMGRTSQFLTRK
jgi:RNA polymerase sigma-70 factor (ECF subfamily)